eukprot:gene11717-12787_t
MSFFNKIVKSVEDATDIGKLDAIVERRVQQYEREIDKLTQDIRRLPSEEEIKKMEQDVIDLCFLAYDKEAGVYMGRAVNADWKEGGGNNLEVRKRMLNRELENRRGKLAGAMAGLRASTQLQFDSLVSNIRQEEHEIKATLPTDSSTIESQFNALRQKLGGLVGPNFPGGLAQFDALVNGAVEDQLSTLKEFILDENKRLTAEAIHDFRQDSFNILFNSLYLQITQTTSEVKATLATTAASDPDNRVITPEVVESVRKEMDHAMSSLLTDLRKINRLEKSIVTLMN